MDKTPINTDEIASVHGIRTNHEQMPNGECRFRLTCSDGNDYIRTVAGPAGGWQKAHFHSALRETYVVASGWMAIAEDASSEVTLSVYWPGDVVTTKLAIIHNVYLPPDAVIHTVKHGSTSAGDWHESPAFTLRTTSLSERDILTKNVNVPKHAADDWRFDGYVMLYNNLDDLIWRIPGFLATGAAILIGFAGSVLSKDKLPDFPPILVAGLFFFVGLLFFLSAYSLARIRVHHTLVGEELARMESSGYFHRRRHIVQRKWPPAAPVVFGWTYVILCLLFWTLTAISVLKFPWLVELTKWHF